MLMIATIVVGLVAIAGIAVVNAYATDNETETKICTSCGNSCTAESNCGLASCGATNGEKCSCGK